VPATDYKKEKTTGGKKDLLNHHIAKENALNKKTDLGQREQNCKEGHPPLDLGAKDLQKTQQSTFRRTEVRN